MRTIRGETKVFPITTGLHQGSALTPYLFTLVMDKLTRHIYEEVIWWILIVDKIREGMNIWIDGQDMPCTSQFQYIELIIHEDSEIVEDWHIRSK